MKRTNDKDLNTDRYLALCNWARKRYMNKVTHMLVTYVGVNPSPYTRIEKAAWNKYKA